MTKGKGTWARHLTPQQVSTVQRIRALHGVKPGHDSTDGWSVYMEPTVGPPHYLELRYMLLSDQQVRWVIEKDGTISSSNRFGRTRDLVPA